MMKLGEAIPFLRRKKNPDRKIMPSGLSRVLKSRRARLLAFLGALAIAELACGHPAPAKIDMCAKQDDCHDNQSCVGGVCLTKVDPPEVCDGKDNDNDGMIDEDIKHRPINGAKNCEPQAEKCVDGKWVPVDPPKEKEVCDGVDNDCDGKVDGIKRPFVVDGMCLPGEETCVSGSWVKTTLPSRPEVEVCNGKDDDCNGTIDDTANHGDACTVGEGECKTDGQLVCNPTKEQMECKTTTPPGTPKKEECNGKDDDCNGKIDDIEPFRYYPGNMDELTAPNTVCQEEITECKDGKKVVTQKLVQPQEPQCNGKNNTCRKDVTADCQVGFKATDGQSKPRVADGYRHNAAGKPIQGEKMHGASEIMFPASVEVGGIRVSAEKQGDRVEFRLIIPESVANKTEFPKGMKVGTTPGQQKVRTGRVSTACPDWSKVDPLNFIAQCNPKFRDLLDGTRTISRRVINIPGLGQRVFIVVDLDAKMPNDAIGKGSASIEPDMVISK